jgi:hypothetical protein
LWIERREEKNNLDEDEEEGGFLYSKSRVEFGEVDAMRGKMERQETGSGKTVESSRKKTRHKTQRHKDTSGEVQELSIKECWTMRVGVMECDQA